MSAKHLALQVELPAVYTADIEGLREFQGDATESEFLLNCVGEPSVVRIRMEVSGEKDSCVVEVWGHIRDAKLVEPSRGYEPGTALTDEQLAENGVRLLRDERGYEWCQVPGDAPEDAPPETDAVHRGAIEPQRDADDLEELRLAVHKRLGGTTLEITSWAEAGVDVRWTRIYSDGVESDERFVNAPTMDAALRAILAHEDAWDAEEAE